MVNKLVELFLNWVWERHHNILSWYVRPLFLFPYCYFAYQHSKKYLVVTLLLFPTSLFWFPAPDKPSEHVTEYLAWEYNFLTQGSTLEQCVLIALVVAFLWLLALAFWKRSLLYGLIIINFGTCLKVIWSVYFAGDDGVAALLPSMVTLLICNIAGFIFYRFNRKNTNNLQPK